MRNKKNEPTKTKYDCFKYANKHVVFDRTRWTWNSWLLDLRSAFLVEMKEFFISTISRRLYSSLLGFVILFFFFVGIGWLLLIDRNILFFNWFFGHNRCFGQHFSLVFWIKADKLVQFETLWNKFNWNQHQNEVKFHLNMKHIKTFSRWNDLKSIHDVVS